jgi:hypothetical protein
MTTVVVLGAFTRVAAPAADSVGGACEGRYVMDRVLDMVEIDWSRTFVCWRGWVVLLAMVFLPAQTLGVVTSWEQHRLDGFVQWVQHVGDTPAPPPPASGKGDHKRHGAGAASR